MTQVAAYIAGPQRSASPRADGGGLESAFPCPKPPPRVHPGALPESQKIAKSYRSMQEANCRISSVVEQRFCKPLVGSSNLSSGTTENYYFTGIFVVLATPIVSIFMSHMLQSPTKQFQ